ncbi:hypothetical protein ACVWYG_000591 [Pedobacter sp. UYEF25]
MFFTAKIRQTNETLLHLLLIFPFATLIEAMNTKLDKLVEL